MTFTRRLSLSLFLLFVLAGCGSSSETFSAPVVAPSTASIEINSPMAKTVPNYVTDYRFIGLDQQSRYVYGPTEFAKASKVTLTNVSVATVTLRIEYLADESVVGTFQTPVVLRAGELLVLNNPEWVAVSPPGLTLTPEATIGVGNGPLCITNADFDNDGEIDLATADTQSNGISVVFGKGNGAFSEPVTYPAGPISSGIVASDLNGDGYADLVVANYGSQADRGNLTVHLNRGDGTFAEAVPYNVGDGPTAVIAADFNSDGHPDLACTNYREGTVSVLLGDGEGSFAEAVFFDATFRCRALTSGDLNEDGHLDLVIANEGEIGGGDLSVLLGDGRGGFADGVVYQAGGSPHSAAVGDLNGDGHLDVAIANFVTHNVSVLLGRGDGTLEQAVNYPTGNIPLCVLIGDYDLDGRQDLAVAVGGKGAVSILSGLGDGTFPRYVSFKAGTRTFNITSADFNFDGRLDFASANFGSDDVSILLNQAR